MSLESPSRTPFLFLSLSLSLPQRGHLETLARNSAIGSIFNQDCYWRWIEVQEKSLYNFHINVNSNVDGLNRGQLWVVIKIGCGEFIQVP